jgi:hypothetical protein
LSDVPQQCSYCASPHITVLDRANCVYQCPADHTWKIVDDALVKLRRLTYTEAAFKLAANGRLAVQEWNLAVDAGIILALKKTFDDVWPINQSLLQMIATGDLDIYIDPANHINFVPKSLHQSKQ